MANCKDCLSYDVCEMRKIAEENYPERHYTENNNCEHFKDCKKFVELPCKVGDTVYYIATKYEKQGRKKVAVNYVDTGIVDSITLGQIMIP